MSSVAAVIALSLALGPPPAAPPADPSPGAAVEPTTGTAPEPIAPDPTIPPPTTSQPGTPKRVYMPGTKKDPVALPTPVEPTPIKPTPVLPTGPQPILPGTDDPNGTTTEPSTEPREPRGRQRRERRPRGDRGGGNGDTDTTTGKCFAEQSRCRTFVMTGTVLSVGGVAALVAGGILIARPLSPLRDDPTTVKSYKPPGAVVLAFGGALLISGIAILASGIASHRRDQSMRKRSAWWRPRVSFGVMTR